ncbi:MAG: ABC transporter permease [Ardenticatenaceae bacterium]|nr:ABC transporter permease [Ardenticatenaceae bacterium]HBY95580.1 ABC transporter permease [Chloroflexota bacterium]
MNYLLTNPQIVWGLFLEHLRMTGLTLVLALLIAMPLGLLLVRVKNVQGPVLGVLSVIYTIPSLSLFVLLIPVFGLGLEAALVALVAYAQVILVRNIVVGLDGIDPAIIEAARGMGMTPWQRFYRVELPLALPVILAGIRIATLSTIAIGTIASLINAGGLGELLFSGVAQGNPQKIVAGSLAVSALAAVVNLVIRWLEARASWGIGRDMMR